MKKGVSFKYVTEDNAEKYLAQIIIICVLRHIEKINQKYLNGPSKENTLI